MLFLQSSGLPNFECCVFGEQFNNDIIVIGVCNFIRLSVIKIEDIGLACCLGVDANPIQCVSFDFSEQIVAVRKNDESGSVERICFEVGNCEKVLVVQKKGQSVGKRIFDGSLILGVPEVKSTKESLFRHKSL